MFINEQSERKVGRPRTLHNDAIFQAVFRVITSSGSQQLTLAAVAGELGCSAPALVKRFGSKRNLLLASAEWSMEASRIEFERARNVHDSPMATLRSWLLLPAAPGTNQPVGPAGLANILHLYLSEASDPDFHNVWMRWIERYEARIIQLLDEAVTRGELMPGSDTTRLGRALHLAMVGAGVLWIGDPRRSSQDRSRDAFDTIVGPHLQS